MSLEAKRARGCLREAEGHRSRGLIDFFVSVARKTLYAACACMPPQLLAQAHACRIERLKEIIRMSETRDSNGALLNEGDNVTVIKDLKVKGSSTVLKRGTVIRGIHLTGDPEEIEGRTDKVKGLVLKTCFLKKA
jgi:protein PhnA